MSVVGTEVGAGPQRCAGASAARVDLCAARAACGGPCEPAVAWHAATKIWACASAGAGARARRVRSCRRRSIASVCDPGPSSKLPKPASSVPGTGQDPMAPLRARMSAQALAKPSAGGIKPLARPAGERGARPNTRDLARGATAGPCEAPPPALGRGCSARVPGRDLRGAAGRGAAGARHGAGGRARAPRAQRLPSADLPPPPARRAGAPPPPPAQPAPARSASRAPPRCSPPRRPPRAPRRVRPSTRPSRARLRP